MLHVGVWMQSSDRLILERPRHDDGSRLSAIIITE